MERLIKRAGDVAVPTMFDLTFVLGISDSSWSGLKDVFDRLAAYEDTDLEPEEIEHNQTVLDMFAEATKGVPLNRIRELAQADREGLVEIYPIKKGQKVYFLLNDICSHQNTNGWFISSEAVTLVCALGFCTDEFQGCENIDFFPFDLIGQVVFTSREEAEEKLAKRGAGDA